MAKVTPINFYPSIKQIHSWLNEIYGFNLGRNPSNEEIKLVNKSYEEGIRVAANQETYKSVLNNLLSREVINALKEIRIPTVEVITREKYNTYLEYEDIVEIMTVVCETLKP